MTRKVHCKFPIKGLRAIAASSRNIQPGESLYVSVDLLTYHVTACKNIPGCSQVYGLYTIPVGEYTAYVSQQQLADAVDGALSNYFLCAWIMGHQEGSANETV